MPSFVWSQALTANQLGFNPLTGWQFERVPNMFQRVSRATVATMLVKLAFVSTR